MKMDFSTIQVPNNGTIFPTDCFRYMVLLKGNGIFITPGISVHLERHCFFTIPQNIEGTLTSTSDSDFLLGSIEIRDHRSTAQKVSVLPAEDTEFARKLFYFGLDLQDCTLPYYDAVNASLYRLMFSALLAAGLLSNTMNAEVFMVIDDINHHFTEPDYDVRKIIEKTGYTDNHFRKLFKKEIGVSPTEFVNNRRLDLAEELFAQYHDRISIKDVAVQCGFLDPYYFSRQLKKRRGISPQTFIKET